MLDCETEYVLMKLHTPQMLSFLASCWISFLWYMRLTSSAFNDTLRSRRSALSGLFCSQQYTEVENMCLILEDSSDWLPETDLFSAQQHTGKTELWRRARKMKCHEIVISSGFAICTANPFVADQKHRCFFEIYIRGNCGGGLQIRKRPATKKEE